MSVYHTVNISAGPFVITFPCYFCQCPCARIPYSCNLGYGRPVPPWLQPLHSVLLNQHYHSHISRTSTRSYLTETNNSFVHDALTFYLLGNLWLLYLEVYAHNNPDNLTANQLPQPHDYLHCFRPTSPLPRLLLPQLILALQMSQQHQDPETPTKQAQATSLRSYENALHLPLTLFFLFWLA